MRCLLERRCFFCYNRSRRRFDIDPGCVLAENHATAWISLLFFTCHFLGNSLFVTTNDGMDGYDYVAMFGHLLHGMMTAGYYLYFRRAFAGSGNVVLYVSTSDTMEACLSTSWGLPYFFATGERANESERWSSG
ncbi:hypothetical protein B0T14DRAFT_118884 [Immersiella caudata]|uniref:Uncharacterized protein n=1 Tax=Immersiella caudata TaxID=314043 RepID=A0AA39X3U8_9PEZI|nr:hypothetical protein B0T14DRAFT_118884 [Immersiella caudata]